MFFWGFIRIILGHIVSQEGVQVDPKKIEVMQDWWRVHEIVGSMNYLSHMKGYKRVNDV